MEISFLKIREVILRRSFFVLAFAILLIVGCQGDHRLNGFIPGGSKISGFDFTDIVGAPGSTKVESDIVKVSGLTGAQKITISGFGGAQGFDISKVKKYAPNQFSVASEDTEPLCLTFNNDGTKMFILGQDNDTIYQYSLLTGFDLSSASYDTISFSVNAQDIYPGSFSFNSDGTKMLLKITT
ncbi:hypothetical protein N9W41_00660 [bacterium]|nr:hypothetical protein [bacterium]